MLLSRVSVIPRNTGNIVVLTSPSSAWSPAHCRPCQWRKSLTLSQRDPEKNDVSGSSSTLCGMTLKTEVLRQSKPDTGFRATMGREQLVAAFTVDAYPRLATLCRCRHGILGGSVSISCSRGSGGGGSKTDPANVGNGGVIERGSSIKSAPPPLAIVSGKNPAAAGRSRPRCRERR